MKERKFLVVRARKSLYISNLPRIMVGITVANVLALIDVGDVVRRYLPLKRFLLLRGLII